MSRWWLGRTRGGGRCDGIVMHIGGHIERYKEREDTARITQAV